MGSVRELRSRYVSVGRTTSTPPTPSPSLEREGSFYRAAISPRRSRAPQRHISRIETTSNPAANPIQIPTPASGVRKPKAIAVPKPTIQ